MIEDKQFRLSYRSSGRGRQGIFLTDDADTGSSQRKTPEVSHTLWVPFAIGTGCTMIFGTGLSLVLALDQTILGIVIGVAGLSGMLALPGIWLRSLRKAETK